MIRRQPRSTRTDTLFPYTTLFRSGTALIVAVIEPIAIFCVGRRYGRNVRFGRCGGSVDPEQETNPCDQNRRQRRPQYASARQWPRNTHSSAKPGCRSEERRVGNECGNPGRSQLTPNNNKKNRQKIPQPKELPQTH